jgi:RNA polymerase sigma-70 factor (ECF subfamily)
MNLIASEAVPRGASPPRPYPALAVREAVASETVVSGDAFPTFYRRERPQVVRALALTLGDADLAAEATDEAMARAFQRWAKIGAYENPGGWVYRVGLNWATSVRRRMGRHAHRAGELVVHQAPAGEPSEPTVVAALKELDVDQRAVIVCRFYLGLSEAETATTLGIRPGTAKSRLHRGLRLLSSRLDHLRPEDLR